MNKEYKEILTAKDIMEKEKIIYIPKKSMFREIVDSVKWLFMELKYSFSKSLKGVKPRIKDKEKRKWRFIWEEE